MLRDQCRAFCQCSYCLENPKDTTGAAPSLRITKATLNGAGGASKDEIYMKSLNNGLRSRAMLASTKNATRFIPDEQLVSSQKKRDAKETAEASALVPLRRRDRLEELLLLEHKARLQEDARVRAERRALGLPDTEEEEAYQAMMAEAEAAAYAKFQAEALATEQQRRLSSGRSTPSSRCSAEHELHATICSIKDIMALEPGAPQDPLTREQIFNLRKLVHDQSVKSRKQVEECEQQPHMCNHCFSVNVQARHLCPQMTGSVAFATTGKVINPEKGVKFGTENKRGLDGTYNASALDTTVANGTARLRNYNPHPYGTGVVFLPVDDKGEFTRSRPAYETTFNNNIAPGEPADADLQYPGSTYNVYDGRMTGGEASGAPQVKTPPSRDSDSEGGVDSFYPSKQRGSAQAGKPTAAGGNAAAAATGGAAADGAVAPVGSSSALWLTTNQSREADMKRFLEFQKHVNTTGKNMYEETASRFPASA